MSRSRSSRRDPIADLGHAATAAGELSKKNNRRPGQTLGHDSPDRRQWIKSDPKIRASTRRWALMRDVAIPLEPPRPHS